MKKIYYAPKVRIIPMLEEGVIAASDLKYGGSGNNNEHGEVKQQTLPTALDW